MLVFLSSHELNETMGGVTELLKEWGSTLGLMLD